MVDKDGTCYEYASPLVQMNHAAGWNYGSVGISFVGGYKYGPVSELQIESAIELINSRIKPMAPRLKFITGHKHASRSGKVDPRFPGEPPEGINKEIDTKYMTEIAEAVGLDFKNKF